MSKKTLYERIIDRRAALSGIAGSFGETAAPGTVPMIPEPPPPTDLVVSANTLLRSAATPTAAVVLRWNPPTNGGIESYLVELALNSDFTAGVTRYSTAEPSAAIELSTSTVYYARVYALIRGVLSDPSTPISFTTADDTTPADQPINVSALWTAPTLVLTWTNPTNANFRDVEVKIYSDSTKTTLYHAGYSATGSYSWSLQQQIEDTSGSLDPEVYVEFRSRTWSNVLNNTAVPSISPVNVPPLAPTVSTHPGYNSVTLMITSLPAADHDGYEVVWKRDGVTQRTDLIHGTVAVFDVTDDGEYSADVRERDVYGQFSDVTMSGTVSLDVLTLEELREGIRYSDDSGTSPSTLKAVFTDDNVNSGGITYPSSGSWDHFIRAERDFLDRIRTVTLSMNPTTGTTNWYLRLSNDGTTWSYYSGPLVGTRTLTHVADEAAARSAALSSITLGSPTKSRIDLPTTVEARIVEVWFRNTAGNTRVDEFYPRRLVQADDIQVENLSAISANLGTITAGTITGATIQTASSGARVELTSTNGFRSYNSYNTLQTHIRTSDGKFVTGPGNIEIGAEGIKAFNTSIWLYGNYEGMPIPGHIGHIWTLSQWSSTFAGLRSDILVGAGQVSLRARPDLHSYAKIEVTNEATFIGGDNIHREAGHSWIPAGMYVPISPVFLVNGVYIAAWSTYTANVTWVGIPGNVKGLAVQLSGTPSGGFGQLVLYRAGGTFWEVAFTEANGINGRGNGIVGVTSSQVTVYASGANFTNVYVTVTGYFV